MLISSKSSEKGDFKDKYLWTSKKGVRWQKPLHRIHSLLYGGPGYYMFQDWVFEVINGKDDQDYLLPFLTKSSIPLHAGSSSVIEFLNKLDEVKTQDELDDIADKNIQLINCSQWDPTKPITISNKAYLGTEILYDELVRKRIAQIRMIREGLQISGFWSFMVDYSNIYREVFVSKDLVMPYDQFISLVTNDGKDETNFEKIQSRKFFDNFLVIRRRKRYRNFLDL